MALALMALGFVEFIEAGKVAEKNNAFGLGTVYIASG